MHISIMLVFCSLVSLVRNSVVLAVYLLFSVTCFFTVHEHYPVEETGIQPLGAYRHPDMGKVLHVPCVRCHAGRGMDGCVMPSDIVSQQGIEFIDAGDPGRVQGIEEAGTECPEIALHFSLVM